MRSRFGRLHHAGPYAFPADENLRAALLSLGLGVWFVHPWLAGRPLRRFVEGGALVAAPIVLFFAFYATLEEAEEAEEAEEVVFAGRSSGSGASSARVQLSPG